MGIKLGSEFKLLRWSPNGAAANLDKTWGVCVKMPKASSEIRGREEPRPRPANLATRGATDTLLLLLLLRLETLFFSFQKDVTFCCFHTQHLENLPHRCGGGGNKEASVQ